MSQEVTSFRFRKNGQVIDAHDPFLAKSRRKLLASLLDTDSKGNERVCKGLKFRNKSGVVTAAGMSPAGSPAGPPGGGLGGPST